MDFESYSSLLRQCCDKSQGKRLHQLILSSGRAKNLVLSNLVIQMYGKCKALGEAKWVFDGLSDRNVFSWTIMINAYAQNGHLDHALLVFKQMDNEGMEPNEVTFISVLGVLATKESISLAKAFHWRILYTQFHSDPHVGTALIHMYGKCKSPDDARTVFDSMCSRQRNIVTWNAMIAAYALNGDSSKSFQLYHLLVDSEASHLKPNDITFLNALSACVIYEHLEEGRAIHSRIMGNPCEFDVKVGTAVVNMYGKCGSLEDARAVFDSMRDRNVISWNAIITVCAQNGHGRDALGYYWRMNLEGLKANTVTLASALEACSIAGALAQGKLIHASLPNFISTARSESEMVLLTSLLNMYAKCGSVIDARNVFNGMCIRNTITWNTIMAAYAQKGCVKEALEIYSLMHQEGVKPSPVTFVNVLYVCSHAGMMTLSLEHFSSMKHDHGIQPDLEHFGCVVDLLGRAGWLKEAEDIINLMPSKDEAVWLALLNACKMHHDSHRGTLAAEQVFDMGLRDSAAYVLLSELIRKNPKIPPE